MMMMMMMMMISCAMEIPSVLWAKRVNKFENKLKNTDNIFNKNLLLFTCLYRLLSCCHVMLTRCHVCILLTS